MSLSIWERGLELDLPVVVGFEGEAEGVLALCIQPDELACKLLRLLHGPLLLLRPAGSSHAVQLRGPSIVSYVALDEVRLLDGDVQVFVVGVAYLDVVALRTAGLRPLYPDELPDTVVDMHDVVAFLQVDEAVYRLALDLDDCLATYSAPVEDLLVKDHEELPVVDGEAVRHVADRDVHSGIVDEYVLHPLLLDEARHDDMHRPSVLQHALQVLLEERDVAEEAASRPDVEVMALVAPYVVYDRLRASGLEVCEGVCEKSFGHRHIVLFGIGLLEKLTRLAAKRLPAGLAAFVADEEEVLVTFHV